MDVLGRKPGYVVAVEDRLPIITEWSGMKDFANCPPDYETWARQYEHYTRFYVAKYCHSNWFEDVVQEIMMRFQERDSLGVFERGWTTRSETGKSNFRSYYIRFVVEYVVGKNRNYYRRYQRECLIADSPVGESETTWLEQHASTDSRRSYDVASPTTADPVDSAAFSELAASMRSLVSEPLAPVVDALVAAALAGSELPVSELALALSCTSRVASARLAAVRSELAGSRMLAEIAG